MTKFDPEHFKNEADHDLYKLSRQYIEGVIKLIGKHQNELKPSMLTNSLASINGPIIGYVAIRTKQEESEIMAIVFAQLVSKMTKLEDYKEKIFKRSKETANDKS